MKNKVCDYRGVSFRRKFYCIIGLELKLERRKEEVLDSRRGSLEVLYPRVPTVELIRLY